MLVRVFAGHLQDAGNYPHSLILLSPLRVLLSPLRIAKLSFSRSGVSPPSPVTLAHSKTVILA
jgi:hypothetical protein